jgi:ATP-dependent Zn protease
MRSIVRGRIMTYMAGRVAEEEFFDAAHVGDDDDCRQINFMFDSLLPSDADVPRYAARLRAFKRGLVKRHRPAIERVAAALLERKTLQPDGIEQAMVGETVKASRSL